MEVNEPEGIIIYTNRRNMIAMLVTMVICSIGFILFTYLVSASIILYPEQRNGGAFSAFIISIGFLIMSIWLIRSLIDLSKPNIPMLIINREGICTGTKTYGSTEFVLSWKEIKAIYIQYGRFCIRPTNKKQLLSSFHPLKRALLYATLPAELPLAVFQALDGIRP